MALVAVFVHALKAPPDPGSDFAHGQNPGLTWQLRHSYVSWAQSMFHRRSASPANHSTAVGHYALASTLPTSTFGRL
jgi:hypothetical protein